MFKFEFRVSSRSLAVPRHVAQDYTVSGARILGKGLLCLLSVGIWHWYFACE